MQRNRFPQYRERCMSSNVSGRRFMPMKRQALDGKIWWCVWDLKKNAFSSYTCHGKYLTRKECEIAINYTLNAQYGDFFIKQ